MSPVLRDISARNISYKLNFEMNPCGAQFDLAGADSHSLGDGAVAESGWETRVSEPLGQQYLKSALECDTRQMHSREGAMPAHAMR